MQNPKEDKFRILKKSNKAIASKLMSLKPDGKVEELLELLGYREMDDEIMAFTGDFFMILTRGSAIINEENQKLKNMQVSDEDRARMEQNKIRQEELKAQLKAEEEYKK